MTNKFLCLLSVKRKFPRCVCNSLSRPKKNISSTQFGSRFSVDYKFFAGGGNPPPKKNMPVINTGPTPYSCAGGAVGARSVYDVVAQCCSVCHVRSAGWSSNAALISRTRACTSQNLVDCIGRHAVPRTDSSRQHTSRRVTASLSYRNTSAHDRPYSTPPIGGVNASATLEGTRKASRSSCDE